MITSRRLGLGSDFAGPSAPVQSRVFVHCSIRLACTKAFVEQGVIGQKIWHPRASCKLNGHPR